METINEPLSSSKKHVLKRFDISTLAVFSMIFLTPLFFVPLNAALFQFSKVFLMLIIVVIALLFFLQKTVRRAEFVFEWTPLLSAMYLLPVAYFISAIFSPQSSLGLFGYQLNQDTFGFVLLAAVSAHTVLLVLYGKKTILPALTALLFASWIVFAFQLLQLFFGGLLPLTVFSEKTGNLVGRWNDLGLFAGLIFSLSILASESLVVSVRKHIVLFATAFVALLLLWIVNFEEAWVMVGVVSFVVLVFALMQRYFIVGQPVVRWAGILPTLGLFFALFSLSIGSGLAVSAQNILGINALEVRPALSSTINVLSGVYTANPFLGSGPNTFNSQWLLHRSADIVQTPFWNISFNAGANSILSSIATGGVVVALAWVVFIVMLLYSVVRALFKVDANDRERYFKTSVSALGVLYLFFVHVVYTPSQSLTILFFIFIGLFMVSLYETKLLRVYKISLRENPRAGFAFMLAGIMVLLFSLITTYSVGRQYVSAFYHNQAIVLANGGNFEASLTALGNAVRLNEYDQYYRTAGLVYLAEANQVIASGKSDAPAQTAFQNAIASAIQATGLAIEKNKLGFENFMARGLVYATVVPLNIEGAYENAVVMYEAARAVNPLDPEIDLQLAQMNVARGDVGAAPNFIAGALSKKADYTSAILLLAQIELDAGNLPQAINSVKNAVFFEPQNSVLLYQLGILLLQNESYADAASAFELALQQTPSFANAKFFLAQAYAFLGEYASAEALMTELTTSNPEIVLVAEYQKILARGENPFIATPVEPEVTNEVIE